MDVQNYPLSKAKITDWPKFPASGVPDANLYIIHKVGGTLVNTDKEGRSNVINTQVLIKKWIKFCSDDAIFHSYL